MNTSYNIVLRFETEAGDICAINVPHADTDKDSGDVTAGMTAILDADAYEYKGSSLEGIKSAELVSTQMIDFNIFD